MQRHDAGVCFPCSLRLLTLGIVLILGLEWCQPLLALAQPNGTSSSANIGTTNDLPPIQEVEWVEDRKPFYKKWWFWTIVGAVVGGAAIAVAAGSGGGGGGSTPPPSGTVTVNGPAPR
jgi:hypothetical protein